MVAGRSATKNKIPSTEIQVIRERCVVSSWGRIQLLILLHVSPMMTCIARSRQEKHHGSRPEQQISLIFYDLRFSLGMMASRIWR